MNQNNGEQSSVFSQSVSWKTIVIVLFFLIGIYLLFPKLIGAEQAVKLLSKVNKFYLILAVTAEFISYCGAAWLLGIILSRLGYKITFLDRFRLSSIAAFAIHFLPIGSFGQGAIDYYFLNKRKVATGSVLIMFILRMIFTYGAFLFLFFIGLLMVPIYPHLNFSPKIISFFLAALIIWGIWYMVYLYRHKEKFKTRWDRYLILINRIVRRFGKKPIASQGADEAFEDIYQGMGLFAQRKRTSFWAIIAGLVYWLGDMLCLFFVFLSFGYTIGWGLLIFGYGVATLAGLISFIPGGLGVTEGSLALIYSGLAIPSSIALMTILVFRFFSFWIWIPVGLVSYLTLRRGNSEGG